MFVLTPTPKAISQQHPTSLASRLLLFSLASSAAAVEASEVAVAAVECQALAEVPAEAEAAVAEDMGVVVIKEAVEAAEDTKEEAKEAEEISRVEAAVAAEVTKPSQRTESM